MADGAVTAAALPLGRHASRRRLGRALEPYLYASPAVILIVAVMLVPLALGLSYAFRDVRLLNPLSGGFVGLKHFHELAGDRHFLRAFTNTLWWTFGSLVFQFLLGFILALILNRDFPGKRLAQALVFLPWAVPTFLSGLNWAWMFNPVVGPLPHWLFGIGVLAAPENILSDPDTAMWGPIVANVWYGVPFFAITLARRAAIDPERALRGGLDRRRLDAPKIPQHHASVSRADHRHHADAAHRVDRQFRRPDRRDDEWRSGRFHADRRELHLHPGVPPSRFRLCLGHRRRAARAASPLFVGDHHASPLAAEGEPEKRRWSRGAPSSA